MKENYIKFKDLIILWMLKRKLKKAKKMEVEMLKKVIKLWQ